MKALLAPLALPLAFALTFALLLLLFGCNYEFLVPRANPCTADKGNCYSIQGEYSHLGCPGQYVETMSIDNHVFFLSCFGSKE